MDERQIAAEVLKSRRYAHLCEDTVLRISRRMAGRYKKTADTVKAVKNQLHQVHGAFVTEADAKKANALAEDIPAGASMDALREACLPLLKLHASTAERLPVLEDFYRRIFAVTGSPDSILDIACGLNPLALPWMGIAPVPYDAGDIDGRAVALIHRFFERTDWPGQARWEDAVETPPLRPAAVALILKALPVLERQQAGITGELLSALPARWVVASFPGRSLSGRNVGMDRHYEQSFLASLPPGCTVAEHFVLGNEQVFIIRKES